MNYQTVNDATVQSTNNESGVQQLHFSKPVVLLESLNHPALPQAISDVANNITGPIEAIISPRLCEATRSVIKSRKRTSYAIEPNFLKEFDPLFESGDDLTKHALAGSRCELEIAKELSPLPTLQQLIRQPLYENWPGSCKELELQGLQMPFGLPREVLPGGNGVWHHTENSDLDRPYEQIFRNALTNLSIVVFTSDCEGGELEIYPLKLTTEKAINQYRLKGHPYALDPTLLPEPAVTIKPRCGRVVIFDAKCVHRVRAVSSGERLTLSGFCLVTNLFTPLYLYT